MAKKKSQTKKSHLKKIKYDQLPDIFTSSFQRNSGYSVCLERHTDNNCVPCINTTKRKLCSSMY